MMIKENKKFKTNKKVYSNLISIIGSLTILLLCVLFFDFTEFELLTTGILTLIYITISVGK